jgi:hypothetical protein
LFVCVFVCRGLFCFVFGAGLCFPFLSALPPVNRRAAVRQTLPLCRRTTDGPPPTDSPCRRPTDEPLADRLSLFAAGRQTGRRRQTSSAAVQQTSRWPTDFFSAELRSGPLLRPGSSLLPPGSPTAGSRGPCRRPTDEPLTSRLSPAASGYQPLEIASTNPYSSCQK